MVLMARINREALLDALHIPYTQPREKNRLASLQPGKLDDGRRCGKLDSSHLDPFIRFGPNEMSSNKIQCSEESNLQDDKIVKHVIALSVV